MTDLPTQVPKVKTLRLILGDQLNEQHPWFSEQSDEVLYVLVEARSETDYVRHHIQKVIAFFLAMRQFARRLQELGHHTHYYRIDDPDHPGDFGACIRRLAETHPINKVEYQEPDEWRLDQMLKSLEATTGLPTEAVDSRHFFTSREELGDFFKGKKLFLMESFYRHMRKKHGVLMDGPQPVGEKWNYDHENRKKLPDKQVLFPAKTYPRDVSDLLKTLRACGIQSIGSVDPDQFIWPITREECLDLLQHFVDHLLPYFGAYQDAMTTRDWSLFHSRLSFAMNAKLLSPAEVIHAVELRWRQDPEHATIAQVEGFIRQILGWREYMRGIYWLKMPEYAGLNYFGHERPLPSWFWTGETKMKCLSHSIGQSLQYAYAHHIQRLMVTGNFALLAGIHPDEVDAWYLGIYIDAIEWVEITNTRGMSQFADGGIVGSKPYVSSANYMHKMGSYCKSCAYRHDAKTGDMACPFNSLYWHFYHRHRDRLEGNPRIGMMYRTWDKMAKEKQAALLAQAETYLKNIETL